jgi:hypothetical protein
MALSIPSAPVDFILLGPVDDRRQLQDSPILGDVWIAFGKTPAARLDLLISPYMTKHAGAVADAIDKGLGHDNAEDPADIAYLQGLVAARLTFDEVLRVVLPKTRWWIDKWTKEVLPSERKAEGKARAQQPAHQPEFRHEVTRRYGGRQPDVDLTQLLTQMIHAAKDWNAQTSTPRRASDLVPLDRFAALAALILWASSHTELPQQNQTAKELIRGLLDQAEQEVGDIAARLLATADRMLQDESWKKKTEKGLDQVPPQKAEPLVFQSRSIATRCRRSRSRFRR